MQILYHLIKVTMLKLMGNYAEGKFDGRRILIARAISKLCLLQQNFILQQKTNLPQLRSWGKDFLQSRKSVKGVLINQWLL